MTGTAGTYYEKIIALFDFDYYLNINNICIRLKKDLCSELPLGQIVILDNISFHKSTSVRGIMEHVGRRLLSLPFYPPDLPD
jgi:putative transposase